MNPQDFRFELKMSAKCFLRGIVSLPVALWVAEGDGRSWQLRALQCAPLPIRDNPKGDDRRFTAVDDSLLDRDPSVELREAGFIAPIRFNQFPILPSVKGKGSARLPAL